MLLCCFVASPKPKHFPGVSNTGFGSWNYLEQLVFTGHDPI